MGCWSFVVEFPELLFRFWSVCFLLCSYFFFPPQSTGGSLGPWLTYSLVDRRKAHLMFIPQPNAGSVLIPVPDNSVSCGKVSVVTLTSVPLVLFQHSCLLGAVLMNFCCVSFPSVLRPLGALLLPFSASGFAVPQGRRQPLSSVHHLLRFFLF